jgi:hypothetical protein
MWSLQLLCIRSDKRADVLDLWPVQTHILVITMPSRHRECIYDSAKVGRAALAKTSKTPQMQSQTIGRLNAVL